MNNSEQGLAALGRNEDRFMAHVAEGEMVVPPVISENTRNMIRQEMAAVGLDPNEYQVGEGMSINPITGQAEFGFLKKLAKSVKKVVKKIAPIAAVIPGPWQPFAAVYQKGAAALKLAKGEGGLGDIMTLMAGGNQKLTGEGGAFSKIGQIGDGVAGNFTKSVGGGFMDSLGNIGKVTDAAGKSSYDLLGYGKNVAKGMASDQQQGYFGAFGGGTGAYDVNAGAFKNYTDAAGNQIFNDKFNFMAPDRTVVQPNDTLSQIAQKNGTTIEAIMEANPGITDPNVISPGQVLNMPGGNILQKTGNLIRGAGSGVGDAIKGVIKGGAGILAGGTAAGGGGINPQMAALALLYGKAVKDAAKKNEGGLTDIRRSIRPDLNPAPVYQGFDLGIRAAAGGGPISRQYFNKGGLAAIADLDMRDGGESEGPGTGTSDDIPAMLSDGEFVMTAAANNGAGGFKFSKTKKGIELIPIGKPNRKKGVQVMNNLMDIFEEYNNVGSMA